MKFMTIQKLNQKFFFLKNDCKIPKKYGRAVAISFGVNWVNFDHF